MSSGAPMPWIEVPKWVDPIKPCIRCGQPIRLITAKLESGELRVQIVDAVPHSGGWVRVFTRDRVAAVHRKLGTIQGDPYIPFRRHQDPR